MLQLREQNKTSVKFYEMQSYPKALWQENWCYQEAGGGGEKKKKRERTTAQIQDS